MLLSAVIHIKALENGSIPQFLSPALRAVFLGWVAYSNPVQAEYLHEGNELRPYTISDLNGSFKVHRGFYHIETGQSGWFRITSLNNIISTVLLDSVFPSIQSKNFKVGEIKFQVQKVITQEDEHPWARESSCAALVEKHFNSNESLSDLIKIKFISPTVFHSNRVYLPFPIPELVFGSWLNRWRIASSDPLFSNVSEFDKEQIAISKYELETSTMSYDKTTWIGFRGLCWFRIISADEVLLRILNLLSDFALDVIGNSVMIGEC